MTATILDVLSWALLLGGAAFSVVGGIGLLRLPDLFTRMHGSGITDTLGATMILSGLALHAGAGLITFKLLTALFFLLVSSPTSTHALARAAMSDGREPPNVVREDPSSST